MSVKNSYLAIAIIFVVAIAISSMVSSNSVLPYSKKSLFPWAYPYEGFHGLNALEYTSNPEQNAMDSYSSFLINKKSGCGKSGCGNQCKKVYGFDGLFCEPNVLDNKIDVYSGTKGALGCFNQSSGLTNSKGSLCLNPGQISLLATRGGNSTGRDSEIGK